jgi:serine/threonine protein phosphatase 1
VAALDWLSTLPLFIEGQGWLVVHGGLNPAGETTAEQAVRLRRWPDDKEASNPYWWELYRGDRLIIYGHDAVRGLQDHRPRTLGLDTGCVYGGELTGFIIETGELITVPALEAYRSV